MSGATLVPAWEGAGERAPGRCRWKGRRGGRRKVKHFVAQNVKVGLEDGAQVVVLGWRRRALPCG